MPVIVNPNAGLPRSEDGKTVYDINAEEFAEVMERMVRHGVPSWQAAAVGPRPSTSDSGAAVRASDHRLSAVQKRRTWCPLMQGGGDRPQDPVIIGERIKSTGKSKFKQALRDHDMEYILEEGVTQQDAGAHILDVNVGLPEIDAASMMEEAIRELQR